MKGLVLFGTRPEAIKLTPVILALKSRFGDDCVTIVNSGQHRSLLDDTLRTLNLKVDVNFNVMSEAQRPSDCVTRVTTATCDLLTANKPDWVMVQGDTATAFAGALAAHLVHVPVIHLEAGLRTNDLSAPWPEESFRQMIARITDLNLAQTPRAYTNLKNEGLSSTHTAIVGNTGYDMQRLISQQFGDGLPEDAPKGPFCLITVHRRENLGAPLDLFCQNLQLLMQTHEALTFLWPKHPNPAIGSAIEQYFSEQGDQLRIIEPLDYITFQKYMKNAALIISDSGGVQEEAASLGVPIAVVRDKTERQDIVELGLAQLVGGDGRDLVSVSNALLKSTVDEAAKQKWIKIQGSGQAAEKAVTEISDFFQGGGNVSQ